MQGVLQHPVHRQHGNVRGSSCRAPGLQGQWEGKPQGTFLESWCARCGWSLQGPEEEWHQENAGLEGERGCRDEAGRDAEGPPLQPPFHTLPA